MAVTEIALDQIRIAPMSENLLPWRCLHEGPYDGDALEHPANPDLDWQRLRARNLPLLARICQVYGTCAMLAWHGDKVVGMVRFYPRALAQLDEAGGMCLQQFYPNGPHERLVDLVGPAQDVLDDRTLSVHCLMTGSPQLAENPYQRRGLGTRLVRALEGWAAERGWQAVESVAYADLDMIYRVTGQAGRRFWERMGYRVVRIGHEPAFSQPQDDETAEPVTAGFVGLLLDQAREARMSASQATRRFTMRKDLAEVSARS